MILDRLSPLLRAMRFYYESQIGTGFLTYPQARVLAVVAERPGATQVELADATRIEPPTMKRHLDTLERAGFITRSAVDGDRRKRSVALTPAGESLDLPRMRRELEAAALRDIDPQALMIAASVLERMETNLHQDAAE